LPLEVFSQRNFVGDFIQLMLTFIPKQEGQHPLTGQRAANFRLLITSEPNVG